MKIKEIVEYLEKYKSIVGLDQYKILVDKNYTEVEDIASVEPDVMEKILKFSLSDKFKNKTDTEQKSILIHELIHSRLWIFDKEKEILTEYLEESYCNDLERGIFKLIQEVEEDDKN